jgi:hypothetical protein
LYKVLTCAFGGFPYSRPHQRREAIARRDLGAETLMDTALNAAYESTGRLNSWV